MPVKNYQIVWEDDVDQQSHGTVIPVGEDEDPSEAAKRYLESTAGPGAGNYMVEGVRELKDGEKGTRF